MHNLKCIYCLKQKPASEFSREHVIPQSFGLFQQNLVLDDEVCRACNEYFGKILDRILARESPQGVVRYLSGQKPISELSKASRQRVHAQLDSDDPFKADDITFVKTDEGEGIALTPGIKYWSSNNKWQFVSLTELESKNEALLDDLDRSQPVELIYTGKDEKKCKGQLTRIKAALGRLKLGIDIDEESVEQLKPGEKLRIAIDVVEGDLTRRAVAKIGFNYLTKTQGREFALNEGFNEVREYIRFGKGSQRHFVRLEQIPLYEGGKQARSRGGHTVLVDWAPSGTTVFGWVTLLQHISYKIDFGAYKGVLKPIGKGHYFDVTTKEVIEVQAIRNPPQLWLPPASD